jgi:hypothetical protein
MNPNELLQVILEIFSTQPSHDELIHNMHNINRIIANDPVGHLSNKNCDDFSILHLLAERGWTDAFLVVLWLCHCHQVPNCFGLLQETDQGVTPVQLLAYDDESMDQFCNYVQESFPEWFERGDFSSAIVLEKMLFCNDGSEEFLLQMRALIQRYPHSLDPSVDQRRSSLLHRYCECSIGSLDPNILAMLVEEGIKRPCLWNGGLTVANSMKETPLYIFLRQLLTKPSDEKMVGFSWECVDTCIDVVGAAAVLAGWISCVPIRFCSIGMYHLDSVKVMIDRYKPLLENLSELDLLHLYGAFEQVCTLPFNGKREAMYYKTLYDVCQLGGKTEFLTHQSENILYAAMRRNLDWSRGLKYMVKDSAKAISERSNHYDLPAPLFAAAVNAQLDTIYELFRGDTGLFESVNVNVNAFYMDVDVGGL